MKSCVRLLLSIGLRELIYLNQRLSANATESANIRIDISGKLEVISGSFDKLNLLQDSEWDVADSHWKMSTGCSPNCAMLGVPVLMKVPVIEG